MRFTDIVSGWPGSVHDARVFRNSPLYEASEILFDGDTHILGDAAYPLHRLISLIETDYTIWKPCAFCKCMCTWYIFNFRWILTPYKDNGNLAERHKKYNFLHSNTRQTIERAFGLLKGKWRRLRFLDNTKLEDIPTVITAACTLHNMCIEVSFVLLSTFKYVPVNRVHSH